MKNRRIGSFRLFLGSAAAALLTAPASAQVVIDNGLVALGVNETGDLNAGGVGLKFLPTNGDAVIPGCACEGWGITDLSDPNASNFAKSGRTFGVAHLSVEEFTTGGTGTLAGASTSATSIVRTDLGVGGGYELRIAHAFAPAAATSNLYQVDVTVQNTGTKPVGQLVYRRAMDWDVPPTEFDEFVTIQGTATATNYKGSSDDGFVDGNPREALQTIAPDAKLDADFTDSGPDDHGAAFDFDFGALAPGEDVTFVIFYGAALTEAEAISAAAAVGAEVVSLGQPSSDGGSATGTPNTFIFAFRKVGGIPIVDPRAVAPVPVAQIQTLVRSITRHHRGITRMFVTSARGRGGSSSSSTSSLEAAPNAHIVQDAFGVRGLRAYFSGDYLTGDVDAVGGNPGFDYDGYGTVFGMDYTLDGSVMEWGPTQVTVGASFGYQNINGSTQGVQSSVDTDAYTGELYGLVRMPKGPYLLGTISGTVGDTNQRRTAGAATVTSEPDNFAVSSGLEGGFEFPELRPIFGSQNAAAQVTPFVGLQYVYEQVGAFTDSAGVTTSQFDDTSLIGRFGVRGTTSYDTTAADLFATIELAGAFDFLDDDNSVLVTAGGITTPQRVNPIDDAALELRVGAGADIQGWITPYVQYNGTFSQNARQHAIGGGVSMNF